MNTDYGFFNLFVALYPVRKEKNKPLPAEPNSMDGLPEIDYSLLRIALAGEFNKFTKDMTESPVVLPVHLCVGEGAEHRVQTGARNA